MPLPMINDGGIIFFISSIRPSVVRLLTTEAWLAMAIQ